MKEQITLKFLIEEASEFIRDGSYGTMSEILSAARGFWSTIDESDRKMFRNYGSFLEIILLELYHSDIIQVKETKRRRRK